jgi:hypothetical protein
LVLVGFGSAWQFQDWRYARQLADQARLHGETLNHLAQVGAEAQKADQDKRLAFEQKLASSDANPLQEIERCTT